MYIITMTLTEQKSKAPDFMAAHNDWIASGFEDGVFLLVGSLKPQPGGVLLTASIDRALLELRVTDDPFVREGIVVPHIQEFSLGQTDTRLSFLGDCTV
ncbi:hypothetical protein SAMN05444004_1123 [Jannaschia faecimaris]|uniref:YCII-related domain-containing protein n=1 Tax=Jannaschia faecimaris TaxID=1244108 RepID=A0A1H3SGR5_9RHOB|nr:hypothetical protein [Jannaschia faecimaris]SDZ37196.1 hypothetical protein SAMN05444004_1123 [Jannaschia faecimaris]